MHYAVSHHEQLAERSSRYLSFACENTHANMERTMSIYEDNIRQLLDSAYSGFGVIELMVSLQDLLRFEKTNKQALMLARLYEPCRGRFKSSWMMWGTAVRYAG